MAADGLWTGPFIPPRIHRCSPPRLSRVRSSIFRWTLQKKNPRKWALRRRFCITWGQTRLIATRICRNLIQTRANHLRLRMIRLARGQTQWAANWVSRCNRRLVGWLQQNRTEQSARPRQTAAVKWKHSTWHCAQLWTPCSLLTSDTWHLKRCTDSRWNDQHKLFRTYTTDAQHFATVRRNAQVVRVEGKRKWRLCSGNGRGLLPNVKSQPGN